MNEKSGTYEHWMLREIYEQPQALENTLGRYIDGVRLRPETTEPVLKWLAAIRRKMVIAASGSSRHAGLVAELMIEDRSGLPVDVEYASEYCYRPERALSDAGVLVVSQSGETADTLAALRKASSGSHPTLAITNVPGSTIDREASVSFPTFAGEERAVPATKSFTAQLMNLYLLSLLAAAARGSIAADELAAALAQAAALPGQIAAQLEGWKDTMRKVAHASRHANSFLFLGRGLHYAIAREGALKLKESAYVHAEGYPSGELKHGPNALVGEGTHLVMLATVDRADAASIERYEKVVQLMRDMREQGAVMIALAMAGDEQVAGLATHTVFIDDVPEPLVTLCEVIPLQLLAYFMALDRGIDVDHPRNLTKAVLTE